MDNYTYDSYDSSASILSMCCPCGVMGFYGVFMLSIWALAISAVVFWVIMIIDVVQRKEDEFPNKTENEKLIWLLIVLLTSWIGALVYYFVVKRNIPRKK